MAVAKAPGRGKYDRSLTKAERKAGQKLNLLEATAQVMVARGYAGTTVSAICEHAGMSRATYYAHFPDLKHAMHAMQAMHEMQAIQPPEPLQPIQMIH